MARLDYYGQPAVSGGGGVPGPPGNPGSPGAQGLLYGSGAPDNGAGSNGQGYIDDDNGDLYTKAGGVWTFQINLRGPEGDEGDPGPTIQPVLFDTDDPANGEGVVGQTWINTTSWDVFYKSGVATWQTKGNIKGAQGDAGDLNDGTFAKKNAANDFGLFEQSGGLMVFETHASNVTSYAITTADRGKVLGFTASTTVTITVPNTLPKGFVFGVMQEGTGQIVVNPPASPGNLTHPDVTYGQPVKTRKQYCEIGIKCRYNASGTQAALYVTGDAIA